MNYHEDLPHSCPPSDCRPAGDYTLYRLCFNDPPQDVDFLSWRHLHPHRNAPRNTDECTALSISTQDKPEGLLAALKSPKFKNKPTFVAKLALSKQDGPNKKTRGPGHYSWWRSSAFDIASSVEIIK